MNVCYATKNVFTHPFALKLNKCFALDSFLPVLWLAVARHQEELQFALTMSPLLRGLSKPSY